MRDRNECRFTNADAWTEGKGSYAPGRKPVDTSEAFKDSEEYQKRFEDARKS
tara:strand:- start:311 stop:466 length:156 start_codon:yes stop_codon:yes gene_type:complete